MLADNSSLQALQLDEILLELENANICLKQILFIPSLGYNLLCLGRSADNGTAFRFLKYDVVLDQQPDKSTIGYGTPDSVSKMYVL